MQAVLFPDLTDTDTENKTMSSKELTQNFELLKKRKRQEPSAEHRRLAGETARMAEQEIQRMQRAVAELESMLQQQGEASADANVDQAVRFPSLPKVVMIAPQETEEVTPNDDEDDEEDSTPPPSSTSSTSA